MEEEEEEQKEADKDSNNKETSVMEGNALFSQKN